MTGQKVTIRKLLPASREEVFDAWLDPDGMRQWMCPGPVTSAEVALEPRVGGRFRIVMNAPNAAVVSTGEIRELERPSKLKFLWISNRFRDEETFVTVELFQRGGGCELVLTHERVPEDHPTEVLERGWGQIAEKLGEHIAGRRAGSAGT